MSNIKHLIKGTGSYIIDEISTPDSVLKSITTGTKILRCTTAGTAAIQSKQAYGEWTFDVYKGADGNVCVLPFIMANSNYAVSSGYSFNILSTEALQLTKITAGTPSALLQTAASYITNNTWYRLKITRTTAGVFTVLIKGGAFTPTAGYDGWTLVNTTGGNGTNPVTDNTHTTSNYLVLDLDASDRISNIKLLDGIIN